MKKFILSALFLGSVFTVQAQTNLAGTAAATRAVLSMSVQEKTRQMYNDLELNEGQYIKIKALNQARFDKFSEIEKMYANDPQQMEAKIKDVNSQLDQEFAQILNPKQFTSYLEMDGRATTPASAPNGMNSTNGGNMTTGVNTEASSTNASAGSVEGELKVKDDKIKAETATGEMKIKGDTEKLKTDNVKYKSTPSETKIKSDLGKTKVEHDKVKTKTETSKKKIKN
jgi:hypothetical protein